MDVATNGVETISENLIFEETDPETFLLNCVKAGVLAPTKLKKYH